MDRLLEATARAERDHFWFRGFRRFTAPLVAQAVRGVAHPSILDCGCGTGHNLTWLRRHGDAIGIDLTWTGLAFARDRGERRVARASATSLPFADQAFDLVTSFDVIITLEDEDEATALGEMHRVLRPGGHVLLNLAALEMLKGNHSILAQEVRRYSRGMLRPRLERAGFSVRRMTYTNATLLPAVAAVRLLQRISGHKESSQEISVPVAPVNLALSTALALEAAAVRVVNMPFGSSLLALAQKL
jgi:SAM-dependent methyltransferase